MLGAKILLACFLGCLWGPGIGLGCFDGGFRIGSTGRCRIRSLVNGHVGTLVFAMGVGGDFESEQQNEKNENEER